MKDTISFIWIIHERTSADALRGLLEGLKQLDAIESADVRILTVSEDQGVEVPAGLILNGKTLPAGVFGVHNVPPQGILFQGSF